ncbi:MAG: hypothetical protein WA130_15530 [Candidatus Methanoperedens sp.]
MTYTFDEFNRMQYLLGKSKHNPLTFPEQNELRTLIAKENPYAQNSSLDDLIKLGLVLVGLYILSKALSK